MTVWKALGTLGLTDASDTSHVSLGKISDVRPKKYSQANLKWQSISRAT